MPRGPGKQVPILQAGPMSDAVPKNKSIRFDHLSLHCFCWSPQQPYKESSSAFSFKSNCVKARAFLSPLQHYQSQDFNVRASCQNTGVNAYLSSITSYSQSTSSEQQTQEVLVLLLQPLLLHSHPASSSHLKKSLLLFLILTPYTKSSFLPQQLLYRTLSISHKQVQAKRLFIEQQRCKICIQPEILPQHVCDYCTVCLFCSFHAGASHCDGCCC